MASSKVSVRLIVYRGFPDKGCFVWSPFVTKLEARLRFGNLSYRTESGSIFSAPRGKIPYVSIDRGEGSSEVLGDSTLITQALIASGDMEDLNSPLTASEKLQDLSIRALLEEKLYFYQGHEKWVLNYYTMRSKIFAAVPWPLQVILGNLAYKKNLRNLEGQGTLKFNANEIANFCSEIWDTIEAYLSTVKRPDEHDRPFWILGGENPTEADATIFAFIASGLVCDAGPDTKAKIKSCSTLVDYARRIHERYFPDYTPLE